MKNKSPKKNGEAVVLSYYHHPLETINKQTFPYLLTEVSRKEQLLLSYGADSVLFLEFDTKMSEMEAEDFLKKILIEEIGAKEIVAGYDTHFGKNRMGNYEFLKSMETKYAFKADLVPPVMMNGQIISSRRIREFVKTGDMDAVCNHMNRYYSVIGTVVQGQRIGTQIGFPTINLMPTDRNKLLPATGVYFGFIEIDRVKYTTVINVGFSPTLKHVEFREVEAFIIGFSGNLYGVEAEVFFCKRIRDEKKFLSKEQLIEAIEIDIDYAVKLSAELLGMK
ncbi:MAG: bifunctional riboflavin kinase/FMN adenylyltransferase [Candidatus Cloacimonetes bacterium]|nr:bifunctional riboflavin kinase/FMN adenylyltransferase [Candidatus Cloacimonadota bacterium]